MIKKRILSLCLVAFCGVSIAAPKPQISQAEFDSLVHGMKNIQSKLVEVCKTKYPQTKQQLAAYITWINHQKNAAEQIKTFKDFDVVDNSASKHKLEKQKTSTTNFIRRNSVVSSKFESRSLSVIE